MNISKQSLTIVTILLSLISCGKKSLSDEIASVDPISWRGETVSHIFPISGNEQRLELPREKSKLLELLTSKGMSFRKSRVSSVFVGMPTDEAMRRIALCNSTKKLQRNYYGGNEILEIDAGEYRDANFRYFILFDGEQAQCIFPSIAYNFLWSLSFYRFSGAFFSGT